MAGGKEQAEGDMLLTDTNNNNNNSGGGDSGGVRGEKYALRPRTLIKRLQQEKVRQDIPKRSSVKSKSRPAPLSKYRRKTANARERLRMREINNAFESLRRVLPEGAEVQASSTSAITKIMTLRLAVEYIKALSFVLEDDADQPFGPLGGSLHSCLHHSLPLSLHHHHKALQPTRVTAAPHNAHSHPPPLPLHHHRPPSQLVAHYGNCNTTISTSSSPATVRTSVSSTSDLEELFSDDSGLLEESFDVFHDLQTLATADPFDILLGPDKDAVLAFPTELCN
ncbi:neurogenic differentiation factor 4-like [Portunus trituberculatus]|uniref:neurogenic differentiation factor 4-like n=1 Tax=Portunus trituberculatus TaxID=210409 RepID=UPI001E1D02D8|nr:neurogenic differentiation factor 4-like [Portunus trituberculatus]